MNGVSYVWKCEHMYLTVIDWC